MTIRSRIFPSDEELGKRDDDLKGKSNANGWMPKSSKTPFFRRKRILGLVVACLCIWLFVHNIPRSALGEHRLAQRGRGRARPEEREPANNGEDLWRQAQLAQDDDVPESAPVTPERHDDNDIQDYDGPIRFYYLASTLHAASKTSGQNALNKNIVYAAADLKSAADLIPMACDMARWKKNHVHVALMGRDAVPLDEVKKVNGADNEVLCPVAWHDARPDFARKSTSHRMEISVAGALGHIESFMHPQAIITNYPEHEDHFFVRAIARKTKELSQTHIELPKGASENLSWMSRLSARALYKWHAASIDIVVQAPQDTSSNLVRLLKSLERADYGGFLPPRLTVELPHKLNSEIMVFLDDFEWPPAKHQGHLPYHELILHRRIPDKRLNEYEASTRFMESFYPYDTMDSHVLLLSPQAELSPTFFHYLKFYMLEYRYSGISDDLFGISLQTPSSYLNGSESFSPPAQSSRKSSADEQDPLTLFLWQAPNTGAALIFSDKWIELHSFLTQFLAARANTKTQQFFEKRKKQISEKLPSWAEYLLDLMKARGYYFLYPGAVSETSGGTSLAVLHNEMYHVPEEFLKPRQKQDMNSDDLPTSDVLEEPDDGYLSGHHTSAEKDQLTIERPLLRNLLSVLPPVPRSVSKPSRADEEPPETLPQLRSLPLLDDEGVEMSHSYLAEQSAAHAIRYRQQAGGCTKAESQDVAVIHGNAEDLFCVSETHPGEQRTEAKKAAAREGETKADRAPPSKTTPTAVDDEADVENATPTEHHFKGTGVAATVKAAVDPESYAATAVAGFKNKLKKGKHYEDDVPKLSVDEYALTPEERSELNALRTKAQGHSHDGEDDDDVTDTSRADDEKDAEKAHKMEPVIDEREYERTDEDAPEKPEPIETVVERPTAAGSRPDATDGPSDAETVPVVADRAAKSQKGSGKGSSNDEAKANWPEEAQDAAIGGRGGKSFKKGRIGGWDIGGYDEAIVDEKAAAAGRLDFARNRGKKSEDEIKREIQADRPRAAAQEAPARKDPDSEAAAQRRDHG